MTKKDECQCKSCACTECREVCYPNCRKCDSPVKNCNSYQSKKHPGKPAAETGTAPATRPDVPTAPAAPAAFDMTGLDAQTREDLQLAEREFAAGRRLAESGLRRMADAVAMAHNVLVHQVNQHSNQHSEDTFRRWYSCMGLGKTSAYKLLQVAALFDQSSPRQQKLLQELSPSLLYAAARPSAPAEAVEAVKGGDVVTLKEYKALLSRLQTAEAQRDAALQDINGLNEQNQQLAANAADAAARARETEKQLEGARQMAAAVKQRADKWQAEAEAAKKTPVPAVVTDESEIERRARQLAEELTAPLREELEAARQAPEEQDREADARNAYDSMILLGRTCQNAWQAVKCQLQRLPGDQRAGAINRLNQTLTEIQTEAMKCL